jgi:hypothetical protein
MDTKVDPQELMKFIDLFESKLQAAFFHMVELGQGDEIARHLTSLDILHLAT